jgi:stage II sporulation protein D
MDHRRFTLACTLAVAALMGGSCRERARSPLELPDQARAGVNVRDVRVLILEAANEFQIRINGPYEIRSPSTGVLAEGEGLPWTKVSRTTGDFVIGDRRWTTAAIEIAPRANTAVHVSRLQGGVWSGPLAYPGVIRCLRRTATTMDVLNLVEIEQYVAGVIACELYASFHPEAFRAQAVAARTYALYQMARQAKADYDVKATQASQVYGGIPTGPAGRKAYEAVNHTRGIVCTWSSPAGERIFCTFYSAACGGRTQAASYVFNTKDIPPLAGGVRCEYCQAAEGKSQAYRWPATSIEKAELTQRLAARYGSVRSIGAIDRVEVVDRTSGGRPATLRLIGQSGRHTTLKAEEFRLAVGTRTMRSTNCTIVDEPGTVRFTHGKGNGHGVGLCQWGMEGQANLGRKAGQILLFYYPGCHLTRAY